MEETQCDGKPELCKGWKRRNVTLGCSLRRGTQMCWSLEMGEPSSRYTWGAAGYGDLYKLRVLLTPLTPSQARFHHIHGTQLAI